MNRFYRSINTAQSTQHPLDLIYYIGAQKEKDIEDYVNDIQNNLDASANYETIYSPDTMYKKQKNDELLQSVNALAKENNLGDVITQGKVRSAINQFTNDPEVLGSIQRTNAYKLWQENKQKLGDKYAPQNDPFLMYSHAYETEGDPSAKEKLKVFQGITPYFDTDKQLQTTLSKDNVGLDINEYPSGIYIVSDAKNNRILAYKQDADGNIIKDADGNPIPVSTKLQAALNTLPLDFYAQKQRDYNYYWKNSGISYDEYLNDYFNNAIRAHSIDQHKITQRGSDWARLYWDMEKEKKEDQGREVPGSPFSKPVPPGSPSAFYAKDGKIYQNTNTPAETAFKVAGNFFSLGPQGIIPGILSGEVGIFQQIFGGQDPVDVNSKGYKELEAGARAYGYIDPEETNQNVITEGIAKMMSDNANASIQGSFIAPGVESTYRDKFNKMFFDRAGNDGSGASGEASQYKYIGENGKVYAGKNFVDSYTGKGKLVSYTGTYLDPLSPFEYGSNLVTAVDDKEGKVKKFIQGPDVDARRTYNYFANGIIRSFYSPGFNKDGHKYNEFDIPSGTLDPNGKAIMEGHYTSELLPTGQFLVTYPDDSKVLFQKSEYKLPSGQNMQFLEEIGQYGKSN